LFSCEHAGHTTCHTEIKEHLARNVLKEAGIE